MDGETPNAATVAALNEAGKKPPRKPRPSELAKKAAKAAQKAKPTTKRKPSKPAKPKTRPAKAKSKPAKKAKAAKKPLAKSKARKNASNGPVRSCRIDLRLSKPEKTKLAVVAKRRRRTITSLLQEWIEKLK